MLIEAKKKFGWLKSYFFYSKNQYAFTVIELMVVVTIMMLMLSAMILNLNAGRSARNLTIAQNQLVSNLRKIQSYTLSGRNLSSGLAADFYILRVDSLYPSQYKIQAIYNSTVSPKVADVETITLPAGISFSGKIIINRPDNNTPINADCALLGYKLPFGRILMSENCNQDSFFPTNDDYVKLVNFVSNTTNYSVSSDGNMVLTLTNDKGSIKTIKIFGSTGRIDF
jgi:type II secretory pathway pseudopilin PulG